MRNSFRLACKFFLSDWKSKHWIIILFALILSVASITTLKFYTSRVLLGLSQSKTQFLGGDLSVQSPNPIPEAWQKVAEQYQLKTTQIWSYPTMAKAKQKFLLVTLQAVAPNYPLVGPALKLAQNTISIDARVASYFNIKLGDTLQIGQAHFIVSQFLGADTSATTIEFMMSPKVLLNLADVDKTKTIFPASRINYQMLMTGSPGALAQFSDWVKPKLNETQKIVDAKSKQINLEKYFAGAENLLQLALIICFCLNGVALFLSTRYYLLAHIPVIALIRSLGATRKSIITIYAWQFTFISLIAAVVGIIIGLLCQQIFVHLFKDYLTITLPWTFSPVMIGVTLSLFITTIFAYPLIADLSKISPLALWRQKVEIFPHTFFWLGCATVALVFILLSKDAQIYLLILHVLTFSVALLYFIAIIIMIGLRKLAGVLKAGYKQGIKQLCYYADLTALQYIAFTLIAMLLLILHGISGDLLSHWRKTLPQDTPNYFVFNLSPDDLTLFEQIKTEQGVKVDGLYPMVRGRLTQINSQNIFNVVPLSGRSNNALHRELNISWMDKLEKGNVITQGDPWLPRSAIGPVVSVENELAHQLGLKIGDTLTITIASQNISAKIINFRKVSWDSFRPNFFLIFSPGVLQNYPTTYVTSFHLNPDKINFINALTEKLPNASVIDIAGVLDQLQQFITKIGQAAKVLLIFACIAAALVFFACLQASSEDRIRTYTLMNVLGASRRYRMVSLVTEFSTLAVLSIGSAFILSQIIIYLFEQKLFALVS